MEFLSHVIDDQVNNGSWKTLRAGRNGPKISHLVFTDDLLLLEEASTNQMQVIQYRLNTLCLASGDRVDPSKTSICFSKNVSSIEANNIASCGGFSIFEEFGRYLGAYIHKGRATANNYKSILDKVQSRLNGWKQQCLSMAGRITLAKSVLRSLSTFQM